MNDEDVTAAGIEYMDALDALTHARVALRTNDGDDYDPCGDTERRVKAEFVEAVRRLAAATERLIAASGIGRRP